MRHYDARTHFDPDCEDTKVNLEGLERFKDAKATVHLKEVKDLAFKKAAYMHRANTRNNLILESQSLRSTWMEVLADADCAISLDPTYAPTHLCRAAAIMVGAVIDPDETFVERGCPSSELSSCTILSGTPRTSNRTAEEKLAELDELEARHRQAA